jgi:hypothetical protein
MYNYFEHLHREISSTATDAGLVVFAGIPDLENVPTVTWRRDWQTFIALAQNAHATILYVQEWKYDPDSVIDGIVGDQTIPVYEDEEDQRFEEVDDDNTWLSDRLREAVALWQRYRDFPVSLECVWLKDGVAHAWRDEADWALEQREALQAALNDAQQVDRRDRVHLSQEAAQKLHAYAYIQAIHPRFPEAKSEEKRVFMAERLFGDDLRKEAPVHQLFPHSIARRASLIYWWDIEPGERATVEERARELHQNGLSIKNIAATLHISDAKVRAAINADDR